MSNHLLDFPQAGEEASPYLEALERNHVPYSVNPEYCEDSGTAVGIQVGVDSVGQDGFAQWVVIPFRERGLQPHGFLLGQSLTSFERSSLDWEALALGLSECRRSHKMAVVEKEHGLSILKFRVRY